MIRTEPLWIPTCVLCAGSHGTAEGVVLVVGTTAQEFTSSEAGGD